MGVREQVARPPAYEAMTLDDTGREREAAAAFNSVVERFGDDDAEDIRDWPEPAGRRGWAPSDHDRQVTPLHNFAAHRGSN
ncbi:MAG TPA: hypothetical protein VK923_19495 [Euzebyales bacterium]|nr:hypothetical protein [Euzebyales bacterium]